MIFRQTEITNLHSINQLIFVMGSLFSVQYELNFKLLFRWGARGSIVG
jgi:hypothetical protein